MKIIRVGVDLAKNVFQVHGVDSREHVVWQKRLRRSNWLAVLQQHVPEGAEVGMECCGGAHHWGSELVSRGYSVKLMAPQFVKPYVKSNKSDRNDAAAICEAMSRPSMRFVALKSTEQQDIQAVHRVRAELVKQRTAKANQIRGLVHEYGLTPKHQGMGGKDRILGISKRGDAYLRTLLIHGARSAVYAAKGKTDPLSRWINALLERRHANVVIVALVNETARMAWALLRHDREYDASWSHAAAKA